MSAECLSRRFYCASSSVSFLFFRIPKGQSLYCRHRVAANAQIDEGLFRVISLDSLISPEYTNNRADWRNACYSLSLFRFIQRAGHFGEVGDSYVGVDKRSFNGLVTRQFLDPAQVCSAFQ